jgi:hypothetical protein
MMVGVYSFFAAERVQRAPAAEYRRGRIVRRWFPFLISFIESREWVWLERIGGAAAFFAGLFLLIAYFGFAK